ncbi:fasciculation and elongation protein zeta-2-like [Paramacrobiotus metropolitanus]|uniref:fasciculation and elongation protein zeta-2-like n=1 Tax=Paramacrobiotus metropolitanus TaxID=2943436 RepID=UPI002445CA80|nr:fasciculation and elongation protein zeta-2-like [Paramacrobiotus metropolitanus]
MADLDPDLVDAPLADAENESELDDTDGDDHPIEHQHRPLNTADPLTFPVQTPLTPVQSYMEAGAAPHSDTEDEEWQDFHGAGGAPLASPSVVVVGQNAESLFGSASSGYSSLAGTCDNLSVYVRSTHTSAYAGKAREDIDEEGPSAAASTSGFTESGSRCGSLEDLVGSLDEKISACFGNGNLTSDVSELAPVQICTHEELLGQSQFWNDLCSSFGTVMPVDWSKTVIRNKLFLPVLGLKEKQPRGGGGGAGAEESDDELMQQLDMHSIVAADHDDLPRGKNPNVNALATADEVIKEIDAMMMQGDGAENGSVGSEDSRRGDEQLEGLEVVHPTPLPVLPSPLYEDRLVELSMVELLELQTELERLTQQYSEILVQELAQRDEQQFEKEVKNSFISELIKVQNKRRQLALERKKKGSIGSASDKGTYNQGKYLTTIIPYDSTPGGISTRHMQVLSKILAAINEDSPTTPTLLTDYILKVLCPKE